MKKTTLAMAAGLALLALGACSGNKSCGKDKECAKEGDRKEMYTGVLPAADADGVRYTLHLEFDDDDNFQKGDYDLLETYIKSDSLAAGGTRDVANYKSEGDFSVIPGTGANSGKSYLKLVQDAGDSNNGAVAGPLYFYVESDSTLVLVGADLQPSVSDSLDYTLKKVEK